MSSWNLRPLSFGEILDGAFTLYRRHFLVFFATALVLNVPAVLGHARWLGAGVEAGPDDVMLESLAVGVLVMGVYGLLALVEVAALIRQGSNAYTGGPVTIGDGLRAGLRSALPLLGAGLVLYALIIALLLVVAVAAAVVAVLGRFAGVVGGTALAVVFSLVASGATFFWMVSFFGAVPAIVVERKGPIAALRRSWRLARGGRARIAAVFGVSALITWLPMLGLMMVAGIGTAVFDPAAAQSLSSGRLYLERSAWMLCGALTFPFMAAAWVLLYYDRRVRVEGYDLEVAASALAPTP